MKGFDLLGHRRYPRDAHVMPTALLFGVTAAQGVAGPRDAPAARGRRAEEEEEEEVVAAAPA